ncbi:hypothetical protein P3S68_026130 [Capsicum galapagoense]
MVENSLNWPELNSSFIKTYPTYYILHFRTPVYWSKPPSNMVKLNSDGSALTNPGKIGAGGIIRDHNRDLIYAYATPLGQGTNNQAEVESAILGLSWCHRNNIQQFILEPCL